MDLTFKKILVFSGVSYMSTPHTMHEKSAKVYLQVKEAFCLRF